MASRTELACIKAIVEASGGALSEREAGAVFRQNYDRLKLEDQGKNISAEALRAGADADAKEALFAALQKQREKVINADIQGKVLQNIKTNFKGNYLEGMISWLGGSNTKAVGGRASVESRIQAYRGMALGKIRQGLESKGLMNIVAQGKMELDIAKARMVLETPGGNLKELPVPQEAKDIAQIFHSVTRDLVERANRAGANIGTLDGFIAHQIHNPNALRRAGWNFKALSPKTWKEIKPPSVETSRSAWVEGIKSRLDLEKSFPDLTPAEITEKLSRDWDRFITGNHLEGKGAQDYSGFSGYKNIAKRISGERTYHFKSAEDFLAYNKEFGSGSLRDSWINQIQQLARNTGLMEGAGTSPEGSLATIHKKLVDDLQSQGDVEGAKKLRQKERFIKNILHTLDGTINIPEIPSLAKWAAYVRNWSTLSKMGFVTPHSFSDLSTITTTLKQQGIDLTEGYLNLLKNFMQRPSADRQEIASIFGLANNGFVGHLTKEWLRDGVTPGFTSKMMDTYFRLNLLDRFDNANQATVAELLSHNLGRSSGTAFDSLAPELKTALERYGVTKTHWDLYRQQKWTTDSGHDMLTPDTIYDIPKEKIEAQLLSEGKPASPANIKRYLDDLNYRFTSYVVDTADFAVPKPGARQMALLTQGTRPGTVIGEGIRFWAQFKPFQVSSYQKGFLPALKGGKMSLVNYLAGTAILGYTGKAISDFAEGKKPKDLSSPQTWQDSMIRGGGFGIYGDYLFGNFDKDRHPFIATFLGPTLGQIDDIANIYTKFKERAAGDQTADPWTALVKTGQRNVPFQNLLLLKFVLDRAIFWRVQEGMSPGSLARMELNLKKNQEQEYFQSVAPTQSQ